MGSNSSNRKRANADIKTDIKARKVVL